MFLLEDKVYGHPINKDPLFVLLGFPCVSAGKESTSNAEDLGLIPGLGRPPGEGKGYPLQYSGLENSMDCILHGVTKSRTSLSDFHTHTIYYSPPYPLPPNKKKKVVYICL